jgi:hypothetical protein
MDAPVILWNAIYPRHGLLGYIDAPIPEIVSRRLGEKKDAKTKDKGLQEAQTYGYSPGAAIIALMFVGSKVYAACQKDT